MRALCLGPRTGLGYTEGMHDTVFTARHWRPLADGRLECTLCPHRCRLAEGQRGFCFVRQRLGERVILDTYGRSSGFCIDPIEKKPLYHFLPGTPVLSFGTAGCNLACRFCQNWEMSKARETDILGAAATPAAIADAAVAAGCRSVAFTYNDPVIFLEYAVDVAAACRERGIHPVAVTAGYVEDAGRRELFAAMDAANVDLKGFSERFYRKLTGGRLAVVLESLEYIARETQVWLEITTLLIPGENDSDAELTALAAWIREHLGPQVPLHFTAFHPDFRLLDHSPTPPATLTRARAIARGEGLAHVYTGNVVDPEGGSSWCAGCGALLIERDGYRLGRWGLDAAGRCRACGERLPGRFEASPGDWGPRRLPLRMAAP
jgi:pyruvate formate lyase activating enzyme